MNQWKADPEKYERLSQPFESADEAQKVAEAFFNAVAALREQYRIPDLVIQFYVNLKEGDKVLRLSGGGGWGNQLNQATMMREAADREMNYLVEVLEVVMHGMPKVRRELITDPVAEKKEG